MEEHNEHILMESQANIFIAAATIEVTALLHRIVDVDHRNKNYFLSIFVAVCVCIYLAIFVAFQYLLKKYERRFLWLNIGYLLSFILLFLYAEYFCYLCGKGPKPHNDEGDTNQNN